MTETSGTRVARLLALVPWLRRNDGVTIAEAAEHFSVSEEQLTTDLWQLIVCGVPGYGPDQLVDIQFWDDDRIHVLDPIALDRPLRLTGDEAAALIVALRVLAQIPGDHDRAALLTAMAKVEAAAGAVTAVDVDVTSDLPADGRITEAIAEAIRTDSGLDIDYASASSDAITGRRIAPRSSFTVDGRVYVEAWCGRAQAVRTFRLDRIVSARPAQLPEWEAAEADTSSDQGFQASVVPADPQIARIAVDPDAAWVWDTDPVRADGGTWEVEPGVAWSTGTIAYASSGWLTRYILGRGGQVAVLEPPEVRTEVLRQAQVKAEQLRAPGTASG